MVTIPYYRDSKDDIVSFKLPEGYIDRWVVGGNRFTTPQDKLYLHASGVDLKPETKDNRAEFKFPASLAYEIRFSINSWYGRKKGDERNFWVESNFKWRADSKMTPCQFEVQQPILYGLTFKAINHSTCPKVSPELSDDVYFTKHADGRLKTIILCDPKEIQNPITPLDGRTPIPIPRCEHHLFIEEISSTVQMDYDRAYLPQWQELETNIKRLLISSLQISKSSN